MKNLVFSPHTLWCRLNTKYWNHPGTSMYVQTYVCIYTIGPQNPSKMKVLSPKDMGEITSKNEGCGFPWYIIWVNMWLLTYFYIHKITSDSALRLSFCKHKQKTNKLRYQHMHTPQAKPEMSPNIKQKFHQTVKTFPSIQVFLHDLAVRFRSVSIGIWKYDNFFSKTPQLAQLLLLRWCCLNSPNLSEKNGFTKPANVRGAN